jgi:hypothetical protein
MNELKTVWLHQPERGGEGIMLFVDRSGIAGAFYFPGRWYFLGDFTGNATGAIDFRIGRQDELNKPPRPVGAGTLRLNADGSAEITWNIDGLLNSGVFQVLMEPPAGIYPPPFPPPPYPVEPALPVPIEPGMPVLPPGVAGQFQPIVRTWAQLFGVEFGQSNGWTLPHPGFELTNRPDGVCDLLCLAFRVPEVESGIHYGRFTQDLAGGGGQILQWLSREPGGMDMAMSDPRAWIVGDLTWEMVGTPGSTQDRVQLRPGEVYYLNAAFVQGELFTEGRVVPMMLGRGYFWLKATQLT